MRLMRRQIGRRMFSLLSLLWAFAAGAQPLYEFRDAHDPDGIGKFYCGREIAHVMGPGGVAWLERPEREAEERSDLIIATLDVKPGQTIADLGAGSGYYTFRIAPLVQPRGKVLAIDVEPRMLRAIRERIRRDDVTNVEVIRGTTTDPNLPARGVDLLLMVDVYHELEFPYETMAKVRQALKPDGRLAVIEFRAEDPRVPIKNIRKMSERQIIREMTAVGFRHVSTVRTLPLQHLVWFEATGN
jgi:predicted methyltransferase